MSSSPFFDCKGDAVEAPLGWNVHGPEGILSNFRLASRDRPRWRLERQERL